MDGLESIVISKLEHGSSKSALEEDDDDAAPAPKHLTS